jgi:hypothetical protein
MSIDRSCHLFSRFITGHIVLSWIQSISLVNSFFTIKNFYSHFDNIGRRNQKNRRRLVQQQRQQQKMYQIKIQYPTNTGHFNMVITSIRYYIYIQSSKVISFN